MMGAVRRLLLALAALASVAAANPVTTKEAEYAAALESASCGDSAEILIAVGDVVQFDTRHLLDDGGALPRNCVVTWRIAVEASGLENYGLEVSGGLELSDADNDETCASSQLLITDQDDAGDNTAITQTLCGVRAVRYLTYQDSVTVALNVSVGGAEGRGFMLRFSPIFACGGLLRGSPGEMVDIETPLFPEPYPRDLSCAWEIEAAVGTSLTVSCETFELLSRRRGACSDYLMVEQEGELKFFCGHELSGLSKSFKIASSAALLYFRSSARLNPAPGFTCSIAFD
ncbi:cubilin [Hyalella azteca]|uniref:Cubilin n=1 Tax=Hyalella azteca TaxID=294128 RepID=A0A8B7NXJ9_HYAAZ|nr:cubilin [Hyalella azteca]